LRFIGHKRTNGRRLWRKNKHANFRHVLRRSTWTISSLSEFHLRCIFDHSSYSSFKSSLNQLTCSQHHRNTWGRVTRTCTSWIKVNGPPLDSPTYLIKSLWLNSYTCAPKKTVCHVLLRWDAQEQRWAAHIGRVSWPHMSRTHVFRPILATFAWSYIRRIFRRTRNWVISIGHIQWQIMRLWISKSMNALLGALKSTRDLQMLHMLSFLPSCPRTCVQQKWTPFELGISF
jgi:hypothetical protein